MLVPFYIKPTNQPLNQSCDVPSTEHSPLAYAAWINPVHVDRHEEQETKVV